MPINRRIFLQGVVYLVLISVAVYTLTPILTVVTTAIRSRADLAQGPFSWPSEFQAAENFKKAWVSGKFNRYVKNSVIITIPTVLFVLCLATLSGYAFAKIRFPGRDLMFYLLLAGMMVPFQAVMIPLYFLLSKLRLLNTLWGVILVIGSGGLPFGTFMMRSFFMGLPDELIESSKLDGCSELQTFWHIMLPLTLPAWASLIIFQAMWAWNNFLVPLLFIYDQKLRPIPLGLMFFQERFTTDYTLVAAAVLISLSPLIVLYLIFQRKFTASLMMGAVKG